MDVVLPRQLQDREGVQRRKTEKFSHLDVSALKFSMRFVLFYFCDLRVSSDVRHNFEFCCVVIYIYKYYTMHIRHIYFQITLIDPV